MENKALEIIKEQALPTDASQNIQTAFADFFKEAKELSDEAQSIVVTDVDDTVAIQRARTLRLRLQKVRTGADKVRKELKDESLRRGKAIDGVFNVLKFLVVPLEEHLTKQEKFAENLEKERLDAIEEDRKTRLLQYVEEQTLSFYNLREMNDEAFNNLLETSKQAKQAKIEAEKKAEADRIAREKAEKEEQERIRKENEALKLANDRKNKLIALGVQDIELLNSVRTMTNDNFNGVLEDSRASHEAKKAQLEAERKEKERLEQELKAKEEAEALRLKEEAEAKRQAELAPDIEKIKLFANAIRNIEAPVVKDEKAQMLVNATMKGLGTIANKLDKHFAKEAK